MIEKIAQDIELLANIKLAGIADLFEKIAANVYGANPNNLGSTLVGNVNGARDTMYTNLINRSYTPQQVQRLHGWLNQKSNQPILSSLPFKFVNQLNTSMAEVANGMYKNVAQKPMVTANNVQKIFRKPIKIR